MSDFYIGQRVRPDGEYEWYDADDDLETWGPQDQFEIVEMEDFGGWCELSVRSIETGVHISGVEGDSFIPAEGFRPPKIEFGHVARNRRLHSTTAGTKNVAGGTTVEVRQVGNGLINIRRLSDGLEFHRCSADVVVPLGTPVAK